MDSDEIGPARTLTPGRLGQLMGVPVWTDANVPTTPSSSTLGNEDAVLVFRRGDTHLWEEGGGLPRGFRFEETLAGTLQIKLVAVGYSAFSAALRPEGVAKITGSSLTTPVF
jgi:hypothetical protein